ncbi:translocation/assembly module TamB [Flammeovirga sp. MY04]|uniref:translocation/assembly module TamB domain-containing protein n=1 Tax=Flammeovirga sp. MY04 TaxID=1191459 RepID=UPI0008062FEE|nr:translocation/assembly module TamB domain-containing protein [Flammeovirga sp. MY04]ANQ48512.1 translocation/assembly module TamB [Flammeovirga sp. MY04]
MKGSLKRLFFGILILFILLLGLVYGILRVPFVQNYIIDKATSYLSDKTNSEVSIGYIALNFPKSLVIDDVLLKNPNGEDFISIKEIELDVDAETISLERVVIDKFAVHSLQTNIKVNKNGEFNFDYLINAFASNEEEVVEEDTTTSVIPPIILHDIDLIDVDITYLDSVMNMDAHLNIGRLNTSIPEINLNTSSYNVSNILLENSKISYTQFDEMPTSDVDTTQTSTDEETPFRLILSKLQIHNVDLDYDDQVSPQKATIHIGDLNLLQHEFDLVKQDINIEKFDLNQSSIEYQLTSDTTVKAPPAKVLPLAPLKDLGIGWKVAINEIGIKDLSLKYDDHLYKNVEGFDANHIFISKSNLSTTDIKVNDQQIYIDLEHFDMVEKSGLSINSLSSYIDVQPQSLELRELLVEVNNSFLLNDLKLRFTNLYQIGDYIDDLQFDNHLKRSHLTFSDALIFDPTLKKDSVIAPYLTSYVDGSLIAKGNTKEMSIKEGKINSNLGLETDFDIELKDVMSEDSLYFALKIDSLNFYTTPLLNINLDDTLRESFDFPKHIVGNLKVKGHPTDLSGDMKLALDEYGAFDLEYYLLNEDEYKIKTNTYNLEVGKILKDSTIGEVSTYLTAVGKGFDPEKDLKALITFHLKEAIYNNYDYGGLKANLDVDRMAVKWDAKTKGDGAQFDLNGFIDMNQEVPIADIHGKIEHLDFLKLNFYEDTLTIGMIIDSDTRGFDIKDLNSTLKVEDLYFYDGKDTYTFDEIKLHAELDSSHIAGNLVAPHIEGAINSDLPLDSLSVVLERYFSQYISSRDMIGQLPPSNGKMSGYLKLTDSELLTNGFIEGLDSLVLSKCDFLFDASTNKFDFDVLLPRITYSDIDLDSTYLSLHANGISLKYDVGFRLLQMLGYEEYALHHWSLNGEAKDNDLTFITQGKTEDLSKEWLWAGGELILDSTTYRFNLEDKFIVNGMKWDVNKENYILSDGGLPYVSNVRLKQDQQEINLYTSQYDEKDTVYKFEIKDYSLDKLTYNSQNDTSLINGDINMDVEIGDISSGGKLNSNLIIDGFGFFNNIIANIKNTAKNTTDINIYENHTVINGPIGNMRSDATFNMADTIAPLDLTMTIDSLLIKPFEKLSFGYLSDLSGGFKGDMKVKGGGSAPLYVRGNINMYHPTFTVDMLNLTLYGLDGDATFDDKGIHFNKFGFRDIHDHLALLGGSIVTTDYQNMDFDLKFSADDIVLINSTAKDNPEYFGQLIIGNLTSIKGPIDHLIIDSDIRISRGTNLTYVYIDGGLGDVETGDDIIEFIAEEDTTNIKKKSDNYELNAKINIDNQSSFRIVIDPRAGDALTLVGGGTLNLRMDAGGDLVMSGQYQVTEGDYSMTFYQLMNKKLLLEKGSSVLWTGDPYNPQANMTAIYEISTSPYPLVANLISQSETNKYKSKRPFKVYMNMRGDVITPELSFKLEYPEGSQGGDKIETAVENLNQDESQLNKQVFALLILGTFLNDAGGDGASTTDMVAGSVSSIISQQLNNVTNNLTNGFVDVNFDVDSYSQNNDKGGSSNRTDVGVTLKKNLFNDRLSVSVGGKVAVNGNEASNSSNTFNTDFLLEYNLLTDGTLKNRLFRSIDAQYFTPDVFKTGVSIVFTKDYNQGKELFIRNLDKRKDVRKRLGMIKRSNTGGGMMASPKDSTSSGGGMKPAKPDSTSSGGMKPAVEIDSTSINTLPDSTINEIPVESDSSSNSEKSSSYMDTFIPFFHREESLNSLLADNDN